MPLQTTTDPLLPHRRARLQAGVVPYRIRHNAIEVLLITARRSHRWLVPKGNIEADLTPIRSAAREAWEEAGVVGTVDERVLGTYRYQKAGGPRIVRLYAMAVDVEASSWPEMHQRRRRWHHIEDAAATVFNLELSATLQRLHELVQPVIAAA